MTAIRPFLLTVEDARLLIDLASTGLNHADWLQTEETLRGRQLLLLLSQFVIGGKDEDGSSNKSG